MKDLALSGTVLGGGWDSVPAESLVRGRLLKFTDGNYLLSGVAGTLNGAILVVTGVVTLWVEWRDGLPVRQLVTQPGQRHPDRDELGDLNTEEWPLGRDGKPNDPWQDTRYLYLLDPTTSEEFTFTTSSWGGRKAIGDLKNQVANVRAAHPEAVPVIRLDKEMWKTKHGPQPKPLFIVVDWKLPSGEAIQQQQIKPPAKRSARDEFNDEVPFE
jgi:hypothetical protein